MITTNWKISSKSWNLLSQLTNKGWLKHLLSG